MWKSLIAANTAPNTRFDRYFNRYVRTKIRTAALYEIPKCIVSAMDLLGSGTVGNGAIAERHNIHPWLRHGDEIVMRVEGLGELHSTVEVFDMPDPRKL